jgi:uncharacterized membrane protein YcaP (DUF421 family)
MDPWRIALRAVFVYFFALALVRASGKRSVKHADVTSFVLALILGDMFDDALWADVPMAQFVVGSGTLTLVHVLASVDAAARQRRRWRAQAAPHGAGS